MVPTDAITGPQRQYCWPPNAISGGPQTSKYSFTVDGLHPQQDILHGQVTSARSNQMPFGITERSLPPDHFVQRNRPCHAALNELALRALRSSYLFNCQGASIVKHR